MAIERAAPLRTRVVPLAALLTTTCAVACAAACATPAELPAAGHLLITIDTDAPLPASGGGAVGIFDSLHLEVVGPDGRPACDDCVREVGATREDVARGATFVVRTMRPAILHVRLFSSRLGVASLDDAVVVQRWVQLPAAAGLGALPVTVALPFEQVGVVQGSLTEPTVADPPGSRLAPQPLEPVLEAASPGEVCVAGGWFWMGDPRLPAEGERTANVPRLVYVTSFCVDDHEVTVGELRASGVDTSDVVKWSGTRATSNPASFCAYTERRGANDERAVNCVPWTTAREACSTRGMVLPSEAQLEYLGTAFGRSPFVWGREPPTCDDAMVARSVPPLRGDESCARGSRESSLPATAAELATTRDVLHVSALSPLSSPAGATIVGLASNVSEWTREAFQPATASCRLPDAGMARDPECPATGATKRVAVRGGNLTSPPLEAAAALRAFVVLPRHRADLGFRCVR